MSTEGEFARSDQGPSAPDRNDLVAEAIAGTSSEPEDHLSSRMHVRPLHIPHPARGATARFDAGNGKRGFITAMPSAELLTSVAYAQGKVFLGGGFSSHSFFAVDAYSGEMRWGIAAPDGGPTSAIVHDGRVIFNTESCTIFVADAETGELRWKRYLGDPLMSQPAADGELVFSAYPANGAHMFGAFRLSDGEPVWAVPIPADVIQAPQVRTGSIYFATMDGTAFKLRATDGHIDWQRDVGASSAMWVSGDDVLLARRVDVDGAPKEQMLVVSARDGSAKSEGAVEDAPYLSGTSRDRQLAGGQSGAWGSVPHGDHLGLANVTSGWAFQGSSPAVADGRAYFSVGGTIRARDMRSGNTLWQRTYAEAAGAQALSPPAVVAGMLFFGTVDGHLYATDIDTGMTLFAYDVGEPIVFQPVIAQGYLYVTTANGNLIGLEIGDPALDGWHMWGGNAAHSGLVETAGVVDAARLASLDRPSRGTMRLAMLEEPQPSQTIDGATDGEGEEVMDAPIADVVRNEPREMPDLPLAGTRVRGRVSGNVARVEVTQQFRNPYDRPIEAVYLFPLPPNAAVDAMEMRIGDRVVRGRIRPRETARREYTEAREGGRRAALLELDRPALFVERVANIAPGERIEVKLTYVEELPYDNGEYELVFPMVAPRRFDPQRAANTDTAIAAASPVASERPNVDLALQIDAGMTIEALASPTHEVEIERDGDDRATVTIAAQDRRADRDFVLRFATGGDAPRVSVLATRDEHRGYFGLLVQPPVAPDDASVTPRDVVFVVDSSSSMRGRPMEQAKAVVRGVLGTLRSEDTFQILAFGDTLDRFESGVTVASPVNIARASEHVGSLRAVGATFMTDAIRTGLDALPRSDERVPMMVLVTDGYVGNESDVLRAMAEHLGTARVYAVGLGSSPNRFLVERAASVGRGRAIVASPSESPDAVAAKLAGILDRPVFTDLEIDWGGLEVAEVYPRRVPDLFAGTPIVLRGTYAHGGEADVRLRGSIRGERFERVVHVRLPESPVRDDAHVAQRSLFARAAVDDRLARMTLREDPALVAEVTALGLAHHLVTPYTSFVAIERTPRPDVTDDPSRSTLSPARSLPGDPEIRVRAPADARAVTFLLPFGESVSAVYERDLGMWTGRFLIPRDTPEGSYPVTVVITLADGAAEELTLGYTVDESAPLVDLRVEGVARRGAEIVVRAQQIATPADLAQTGMRHIDPSRVMLLSDANRVAMRWQGAPVDLEVAEPGVWEARVTIPEDAEGVLEVPVYVIDMAANVRVQSLRIEVQP